MIRALLSSMMNPSLMKISVFGASIARRPVNSAVSACDRLVPVLVGVARHRRAPPFRPRPGTPPARRAAQSGGIRARCTASSIARIAVLDRERLDERDVVRRCIIGGVFCPTIRAIACLIRARSAVNGVDGAPRPMPATATRSDGASRSMNALAALRDRHRAAEADVRLIDGDHDQPAAGRALVGAVAVGRRRRRRGCRRRSAAPTPR